MGRFKDPTRLSQWEGYFRIIAPPSFLNKISMNITWCSIRCPKPLECPSFPYSLFRGWVTSSAARGKERRRRRFSPYKKYLDQPTVTRPIICKSFLSTQHYQFFSWSTHHSCPYTPFLAFLPILPFFPNTHYTSFLTFPLILPLHKHGRYTDLSLT